MATAQKKSVSLIAMLEGVPRVANLIEDEGTIYLGACIVQAPGAWTRVGPTWRTRLGDFIVVGPGVAQWGTTEGLGQLASDGKGPKPKWHAVAVTSVPTPNLVYAIQDDVLSAPHMEVVASLTEEADEMAGD